VGLPPLRLVASRLSASPFDPENHDAYRHWRAAKLRDYPTDTAAITVAVRDPGALTPDERQALTRICGKTNFAVYTTGGRDTVNKDLTKRLGAQLGLSRLDSNPLADEDSITSLQYVSAKSGRGYIPYSNRRLLWHTDGYYNPPERRIRAFILHCVSPAAKGGENALLDHEIAYIRVRDANPEFVRALMVEDAMTIPPNTEEGTETRAAQSGPVFSIDPETGCLHMRYTARTRSIVWKDDAPTRAAVAFLEEMFAADDPCIFRHRLEAGQGVISNNVLHNRSEFEDNVDGGGSRLLYRARYYDRITGTADACFTSAKS